MRDWTDSEKKTFKSDKAAKRYVYVVVHKLGKTDQNDWLFGFGNDKIVSESLSFTESLISEDNFKYGCCEAPIIEMEIDFELGDLTGHIIEVYLRWYNNAVYAKKFLGLFKVSSCEETDSNKITRKMIAYGKTALDIISENSLEISKKTFCFNYFGTFKFDVFKYLISNLGPFFDDLMEYGAELIPVAEFSESEFRTEFKQFSYIVQGIHLRFEYNSFPITHVDDLERLYFTSDTSFYNLEDVIEEAMNVLLPYFFNNKKSEEYINCVSLLKEYAHKGLFNITGGSSNEYYFLDDDEMSYIYPYIPYDKKTYNTNHQVRIYIPKRIIFFTKLDMSTGLPDSNFILYEKTLVDDPKLYSVGMPVLADSTHQYNGRFPRITLDLSKDTEYSFLDILKSYLELCGYFGKYDEYDHFIFKSFDSCGDEWYPNKDTYPNPNLYPRLGSSSEILTMSEYSSVNYNLNKSTAFDKISCTFTDKNGIDKFTYRDLFEEDAEDEDNNEITKRTRKTYLNYSTYSLGWNWLIQNHRFDKEEIDEILDVLTEELKKVEYFKGSLSCLGIPWVEPGDKIYVKTKNGFFQQIVLRRTMSGIHFPLDEITSN